MIRASDLRHFLALTVAVFVVQLAEVLYFVAGRSLPNEMRLLGSVLVTLVVYSWFMRFAREHRVALPVDLGMFLYMAWWVVVPVFVFQVSRKKAGWTVLAILTVYAVSYGIAFLVFRTAG